MPARPNSKRTTAVGSGTLSATAVSGIVTSQFLWQIFCEQVGFLYDFRTSRSKGPRLISPKENMESEIRQCTPSLGNHRFCILSGCPVLGSTSLSLNGQWRRSPTIGRYHKTLQKKRAKDLCFAHKLCTFFRPSFSFLGRNDCLLGLGTRSYCVFRSTSARILGTVPQPVSKESA